MKRLTPFAGLLFIALFLAGCQKDEMLRPDSDDLVVTSRDAADADIYYSANPACLGDMVTVTFYNGTASANCGQSRIQIWGPGDSDWQDWLPNTTPVNGEVSMSFTPATTGIYRFRGFSQSAGGGCTFENVNNFEDESLVVIVCDVCYDGETAWSDGPRYTEQGNWATYTEYNDVENTVTLYAGQTLDAGTVHFDALDGGNVDITITLNAGWVFAEVDENVKIQGYSAPPSGNPSPGQFDNKFTADSNPYTVTVPDDNYFGVHVDVWQEVECPE